jgi:rRNA processing protein Gar1
MDTLVRLVVVSSPIVGYVIDVSGPHSRSWGWVRAGFNFLVNAMYYIKMHIHNSDSEHGGMRCVHRTYVFVT